MNEEHYFGKRLRGAYTRQKKKQRISRFKKILYGIAFLFILLWLYKFSLVNPVDPENNDPVIFKIAPEFPPRKIAKNLKDDGLIHSDLTFYLYLKNNGLAPHIKAGNFLLAKNKSAIEIAKIITENPREIVFLIPEGFTLKDIDEKLSKYELINKGEFLTKAQSISPHLVDEYSFLKTPKSLEGFLFPDTYFIDANNFTVDQFIPRLLKNFEKKAIPEISKYLSLSSRSIDEIIIMASIIEKEVRTAKDRSIVSGILWKRLDSNWLLGADATILYITGKKSISDTDLDLNSSYNSRKILGLPPTPISNPGLDSIKASLIPKSTQYWYYLTPENSNEVIYAVSNEEHNQNKAKHL